jgi:hypothetical protein
VLVNVTANRPGARSADGVILFSMSANSPLYRIPASGGEPVAVTRINVSREAAHRVSQFLPDGRHFLYYVSGTAEASGMYLGSLDGGEPKRLAAADTGAAYLAPDMIVFIRQTTLLAQHIDLTRGVLAGEPLALADPVGKTEFKPRRVVEIGCGFSSGLLLDVSERFFEDRIDITLIDPSLDRHQETFEWLRSAKSRLLNQQVQDVSLDVFERLERNDIQ